MAEAKRITKKVEKVITTTEEQYELSMNKDELQALIWVLNRVGGNPNVTPRGKISAIINALTVFKMTEVSASADPRWHSLYFADPLVQ